LLFHRLGGNGIDQFTNRPDMIGDCRPEDYHRATPTKAASAALASRVPL